jgi:hypothetical protein
MTMRQALLLLLLSAVTHPVKGSNCRYGLQVFLSNGVVVAAFPTEGDKSHGDEAVSDSWLEGFELQQDGPASGDCNGSEGLDCLELHPLLQMPCGFSLTISSEDQQQPQQQQQQQQQQLMPKLWTIPTFLDTGAQRTIMSYDAVKLFVKNRSISSTDTLANLKLFNRFEFDFAS